MNDIKLKMNKNYTTRQFRGWRVLAKIHAWGRIYDFDDARYLHLDIKAGMPTSDSGFDDG